MECVVTFPLNSNSMSEIQTTVVICARNAALTIARAVESAKRQGQIPIIVVDDGSTDATAAVAVEAGQGAVTLVRPERKVGLGNARQKGIECVDTKFAMWLDADDELMPGRVAAMEHVLRDGADIVFDEAHLVSSVDNSLIRHLDMPAFMLEPGAMVRNFERNYLPGPAWPAARTQIAKEVGYDAALPTGEDLDFNLRALRLGARFGMSRNIGYRQFAYAHSLSRDLSRQRGAVREVMKKHDYKDVKQLFDRYGFDGRIAFWALCSMAIFREEYVAAARFLKRAFPSGSDANEILEEEGPLPVKEGWKHAFFAGTLELLTGGEGALKWLQLAEEIRETAEGANNLGVAHHRAGNRAKALAHFELADSRLGGYRDALINLQASLTPSQITTHPIRLHPSRSEYPTS